MLRPKNKIVIEFKIRNSKWQLNFDLIICACIQLLNKIF
jgi:hypothetical protein